MYPIDDQLNNPNFLKNNMMKLLLCALVVLCLATSEVIDLKDDNFELLTQMNSGSTTGRWFVKFYAPWCGHCKKLIPIWEDLAEDLNGEVNVAQVDATENPNLSKLYDIQGFPTLYYFENGQYTSYEGDNELESLKQFALEEYSESEFMPCPHEPSFYETKIQELTELANSHLARNPFTTCFALMGAGAGIGIVMTLLVFCCKKKRSYEPVTEEKKND